MYKAKGFTLIEIMVASSIFIIVMVIAVGAVFSLVDGNRKAQALNSVVSNLNIALESMVREIRTGTDYNIEGDSEIQFFNLQGAEISYKLVGNTIERDVISGGAAGGVSGEITAPEVVVTSLRFIPKGIGNDGLQPLILLQIKGTAGSGKYLSPFTIQTLISERNIEN